jgi:hypothetical protein
MRVRRISFHLILTDIDCIFMPLSLLNGAVSDRQSTSATLNINIPLRSDIDMTESKPTVDNQIHKKLAVDLFNLTWDLIEKTDRNEVEDETMVNAAHASRFHWGMVGTPLHFTRGEWQISRVYSLMGRAEPALFHANKSLNLCLDNQLGDFDLGFAYEALARAYAVQGDMTQRDENIAFAKQSAEHVGKETDRMWLLKNVHTVQSLSLPKWGDN